MGMVLFAMGALACGGKTQKAPPVLWQHTWNPSPGADEPYFLAMDTGGITLAGYDDSYYLKYQFDSGLAFERISHDGFTVWNYSENPSDGGDILAGVVADETGFYTAVSAGVSTTAPYWRIQKLGFSNHAAIWSNESPQNSINNVLRGIEIGAESLYLAASYRTGEDDLWRLQKSSTGDGSGQWRNDINPIPDRNDRPSTVAVFGDAVYVAGTEDRTKPHAAGGTVWRVHRHDRGTGELIWSRTLDLTEGDQEPIASAADADGVYVVGRVIDRKRKQERIEKRRAGDGSVVWEAMFGGGARATAVDKTGLYVVGSETFGGSGTVWRVEKRSIFTGELIWSDTMDPGTQFGSAAATAIGLDSSGAAYIAGWYSATPRDDDLGWRLEKR